MVDTVTKPVKDTADKRRVFQVIKWIGGVPFKENIYTLLRKKTMVGGTEIEGAVRKIKPNAVYQYILAEGAEDHKKQLSVLRKYVEDGILEEVAAENEGQPWLPEAERVIIAKEAELKKLKAARS